MASLQTSPSLYHTWSPNSLPQLPCCGRRGSISFLVRAEQSSLSLFNSSTSNTAGQVSSGRRQLIAISVLAPFFDVVSRNSASFAAETKKGFLLVSDNKDEYSFLYPFGWQEVVIEGQDKVFKDVIEPLESVSVSIVSTSKQTIREFGPPQQVGETLIKKVLAPPSQRTKLIEASEHEIDGKIYYTFEFLAQAPNYTRHALSTVSISNGKFYTLTTGANERRWEKMKDRLHTVVDSFKISNV